MSGTDAWYLVVIGYALLLAWPVSTAALLTFGIRYIPVHRGVEPGRPTLAGEAAEPTDFWIVVPALNEERVVGNTVAAALGLQGPSGVHARVLVVNDGSDDGTAAVLAAIDHPRLHVLTRELPDARRGKGEALNAAYRWIRDHTRTAGTDPDRVVIGIIDGDGQGSPNILQEVSRMLRDPRIGAVQCRVRIRNRNRILGAVQDLEFGSIVNACQSLRDSLDTVGLGGNGQFTRLSALIDLGDTPWSGCLVEDLELGLRMHLDGVGIRYVSRANVTQQGLVDVRRLVRQRTRWAQGNMQCAVYLRRLVTSQRIPFGSLMEILHYLLAPWLNAVVTAAIAGLALLGAGRLAGGDPMPYAQTWADLATGGALLVTVMTLPGFLWALLHRFRLGDERSTRLMLAALAYPAFLMLGMLATYRAVGRQIIGRQTWAKTERVIEDDVPAALPDPVHDKHPVAVA